MKKILFLSILLLSFSANAAERQVRLICVSPTKVVIEERVDGVYTDENMSDLYIGKKYFVMDRKDIPQNDYIEQLRCGDNGVTSDLAFKPDFVVKKEAIKAAEDAVDAELAKPERDPVKVIELQRNLDKAKGK